MDLLNEYRVHDGVLRDAFLLAFEDINTPRSLSCAIMLRNREFRQLAELQFDAKVYNSFDEAEKAFKATELLRKSPWLKATTSKQRKATAVSKSLLAEQRNSETNRRLRDLGLGFGENPRAYTVFRSAQRKIASVLGTFRPMEWLHGCRWGPGSDALVKRPFTSSYHKLVGKHSSTNRCQNLLWLLSQHSLTLSRWLAQREPDGDFSPLSVTLKGNKFTTVPKSALVDRPICIEPGWNMFLQLGIGKMIRSRLKRVGIDLDSQELNQALAVQGSLDGFFCTIDLESASDSVARLLVQILLSPEYGSPCDPAWYALLESLRCAFTLDFPNKGDVWLNEKFSSMGNGFTFELESLIFWALSSAAAEHTAGAVWAVYGDDIIVDKYSFTEVVESLSYFGFSVNTRKTFSDSYFRESCGANAWEGVEMLSFRFDQIEDLQGMFSVINGLRRIGCLRAANFLETRVPRKARLYGPAECGDSVIFNPDFVTWSSRPYGRVDQYFFWSLEVRVLQFQPRTVQARWLEPAVIHSLTTMVPPDKRDIISWMCRGRRGSEGLVPLTCGKWTVGRQLISMRDGLGSLRFGAI